MMLPVRTMSPPGCSLSARTASTASPDSTVVCSQPGSVKVEETTYFSTWFRYAVIPLVSSVWCGQ